MGRFQFRLRFLLALGPFLLTGALSGDTVVLRTGGRIKECRIIKDDEGLVTLRTPGGVMGVPRREILRIEKQPSVFDELDARKAKLRPTDAKALFDLAVWCRDSAGLRQESEDLLRRVLILEPNHLPTRKLLWYFREGGEWKRLPPLTLFLRVKSSGDPEGPRRGKGDQEKKPAAAPDGKAKKEGAAGPPLEADVARRYEEVLREQLDIVLKVRTDVELAAGSSVPPAPAKGAPEKGAPEKGAPEKGAAEKELDVCLLQVDLVAGKSEEARFYGQVIRGPATHVVLDWKASAPWTGGKGSPAVHLAGEVPGSADPSLPVIDALTRGHQDVHQFFDQLQALRLARRTAPPAKAPDGKKK